MKHFEAEPSHKSSKPRRALAAALLALLAYAAPAAAKDAKDPRLKWEKSWGPMVPHKKFPKDCSLCHVAKRWDVLRPDFKFDHAKETGYPLIGAHAGASCLRCHNDRGPVKAYLSRGCSGCHVDPHKSTLGLDCERCHSQAAWVAPGRQGQKIAEHARYQFPLTGMHAVIDCRQCHLTADRGNFSAMPTDCQSCHSRDYARAPNHAARNFPTDCKACHQTSAWPGAVFNHSFLGANPSCISCHAANFNSAPNHIAQNFPTTCLSCHTGTTTWLGALFDHSPLGPNPVCATCHAADYARANSTPASKHAANGFPQTCQNCHTFAAWGPGTAMQHSFVPNTCQTCHTADFNAAASPVNHAAQGIFISACSACHTGFVAWNGFTHNPSNCFNTASNNAHHNARCVQCHTTPTYTTSSCTACHADRGVSCN